MPSYNEGHLLVHEHCIINGLNGSSIRDFITYLKIRNAKPFDRPETKISQWIGKSL